MEENKKTSDFKPKSDWSVQEALDFANTLANHNWTREANADTASSCIYSLCRLLKKRGNEMPDPDCIEICAKCKDGDIEPKHCEYYGEPSGCNSPIYGEHPQAEKSSVADNAAKLREVLKTIRKRLVASYESEASFMRYSPNGPLVDLIDAALATPAVVARRRLRVRPNPPPVQD